VFAKKNNAVALMTQLSRYNPFLARVRNSSGRELFKVRIGFFETDSEGEIILREIQNLTGLIGVVYKDFMN